MGQAEQDPDWPRSVSNVFGKVQSHLCLTEWQGKWKCRRGKTTLGAASVPLSVLFLQPMLHSAGSLCYTLVSPLSCNLSNPHFNPYAAGG